MIAHKAPAELGRARATLAMAWASPQAEQAIEELEEASRALRVAEQEARARPGSREAEDAAYVAERKAERARLVAVKTSVQGGAAEGVRERQRLFVA